MLIQLSLVVPQYLWRQVWPPPTCREPSDLPSAVQNSPVYTFPSWIHLMYITVPSAAIRSNEKRENYIVVWRRWLEYIEWALTIYMSVGSWIKLPLRIALRYHYGIVSFNTSTTPLILTNISMKAPRTQTKEINPDSATRVRPIVSIRVKQTMLVPWLLLERACSSGVHDMVGSRSQVRRWMSMNGSSS